MLIPSVFGGSLFDDFDTICAEPWISHKTNKTPQKSDADQRKRLMNTDVKETKENYILEMELPGFSKDEVQAELKEGYLTVRASKAVDKDEQKDTSGKYIRRERYLGACERTFYVGKELTEHDIKAAFKNGVLVLEVPKKEAQSEVPKKNYIAIEGA